MPRHLIVLLITVTFLQTEAQSVRMLTLQECIDIALQNNLQVKQGYFNLKSAEISLRQSRMSLLPTVNLGSSLGKNFGRAINPVTNAFINRNSNTLNFQGATSLTLFSGFRLANTLRQSSREFEAGNQDLVKARNDVTLNVVSLYTSVIFNKELLDNARFQLQSAREQLSRIEKQVAAGALPMSNELNQEAQVATAEVNMINQENALNLSLLQLKQAMQIPGGEQLDVVVPEISPEDLVLENTPEQIFSIAAQTMPEIKSAMLRVESAELALRAARGGFSPRLTFNAIAQTNYASISNTQRTMIDGFEVGTTPVGVVGGTNQPVFGYQPVYKVVAPDYGVSEQLGDNLFKALSLQLNVPLFNGLQARSTVQRAAISKELAEISQQQQRNTLRQSIETAFNDALAASKTYAASLKQVNARNEAYRMTKQRFEIGASNYVEYRISETDLFQSRSDLARAKFNFIFRKKLLDFYQGKPITL
ncbi:MAG: TolC family protein [Bacteroidota bacterium]